VAIVVKSKAEDAGNGNNKRVVSEKLDRLEFLYVGRHSIGFFHADAMVEDRAEPVIVDLNPLYVAVDAPQKGEKGHSDCSIDDLHTAESTETGETV
jgi:hypothetical protein